MAQRISVTEFVRNFADLINRVAYRGERLVLVRGSREVAEVRPVPEGGRLGDLGDLLAELPRLGEDATAFANEVDAARAELARQPLPDPWHS